MNSRLALSIVIPTHNRAALLQRSLEAMTQQSLPPSCFEVIVVADACRDDTAAMVLASAARVPYRLALLGHTARSAAASRNLGATRAQGDWLLFLDDDVVAEPELVRQHWVARAENGISLGYSKPVFPIRATFWQLSARLWWEDRFRDIGRPGHRFSFRDFFSGNVSLPATLFRKVGGFDPSMVGRLEDYELGIRLLKEGTKFSFLPRAIGHHHESTDLEQWLGRLRQEGEADVLMGQRHPELRTMLFSSKEPTDRRLRRLRRLAFDHPRLGDWMNALFVRQTRLYERWRLRGLWFPLLGRLREYNYWRGVSAAIGHRRAFQDWLQEAPLPPAVAPDAPVHDLASSRTDAALAEVLDLGSRVGLRLLVDGSEVLALPPKPGCEPLRPPHLAALVSELAESELIPALALKWVRAHGRNLLCQSDLPRLI